MPSFDLRGIKVAKYVNTSGTITYTEAQAVGEAMTVDLQLKFAEGRLYAESTLAEYMKKATGGSISIGVKYINSAAQQLMFGARAATQVVTVGTVGTTINSLKFGSKDAPKYVGIGFYAPDMIDGVEKYTAVKVCRALFGQPSMTMQTLGDSITFNTPTTTGEFMADHSTTQELLEVAICDTEAQAQAWITRKLA